MRTRDSGLGRGRRVDSSPWAGDSQCEELLRRIERAGADATISAKWKEWGSLQGSGDCVQFFFGGAQVIFHLESHLCSPWNLDVCYCVICIGKIKIDYLRIEAKMSGDVGASPCSVFGALNGVIH